METTNIKQQSKQQYNQQCKYLSFKLEKPKRNESLIKTIECLNSKKVIKEYTVYSLNQYTFQFVVVFKIYTSIKFINLLTITDAKILNLKEYESLIARLQDHEYDVYLTYTNPNTNNDINTNNDVNNTNNDNIDNNDTNNNNTNNDNFKSQTTKEEQSKDQQFEPSIEVLIKEDSQLTEELEEIEEIQESYSSTLSNVNEDIVQSNVNEDNIQSNVISQIQNKDNTTNSILTNIFKPIKNYYIWDYNQQIVINKIQQLLDKHQIQSVSQISYSVNGECWNIDDQDSQALVLIIKSQQMYDQIYNHISDLVDWSIDEIKTVNGFINKFYKCLFIVSSQYIQQIMDISKKYCVQTD